MKQEHKHIDKILPFGELMRGFSNQSHITKYDLKNFLNQKGVFFSKTNKENLVPCISTLLLSPTEFDSLRELQNTREDNVKKNTSRLEWNSEKPIYNALSDFEFKELIPNEGVNYQLRAEPIISLIDNDLDRVLIEYEIERNDFNKSWYESTNVFKGKIELQKASDDEIRIIKSYTSSESNDLGNNLQKSLVTHFKKKHFVEKEKELIKILFGDFSNEDRIVFFYRLSTNTQSSYFEFKDIINMEFKPDDNFPLPTEIDWMNNKSQLKLKGNQIHDTFFIRDQKFHKNLQFWEMESSFKFTRGNHEGNCNVVFLFRDFIEKGNQAEFEITISSFSLINSSDYSNKHKNQVKNEILDLFETIKDETYRNFIKYLETKNAIA
jgi:hypothetical protein